MYATYALNLIPPRGNTVSPRELITGIKPSFKTHLPVAFGSFVQTKEKTKNDMTPRTVTAIALLPLGNGSVKFASLLSGNILIRDQFTIVEDIPYEWLLLVKSLQERGCLGVENMIEEIHEPKANEGEDEEKPEPEKVLVLTSSPNGPDPSKLSIKQAINLYGKDKVYDAVGKELKSMIDLRTFVGVPLSEDVPKENIVPSRMFLKIKATGELKARLVAGGHRQSEEIYERKSSPTAAFPTVVIVACESARRAYFNAAFDVPTAFLQVLRNKAYAVVYMIISKDIAEILVFFFPEMSIYILKDGSMLVLINGGIYGLIESSNLWFLEVSKHIVDTQGLKQSPNDPCLFIGIRIRIKRGSWGIHHFITMVVVMN